MKQNLLFLLILFGCSVSFIRCEPDLPVMQRKIKRDPGVVVGPYSVVYCPDAGADCEGPPPVATEAFQTGLNTFYRMQNHDSVLNYFEDQDWQQIFPGLATAGGGDILSKVMSGAYTVSIDAGGNVIFLDSSVPITDQASYLAAARYAILMPSADK